MAEPKILYGGQAVIEGVMMRGRRFVACAVRRENGEILLKSETIPQRVYAGLWSKAPFLRALPLLWDTLVLGTQMLLWSAQVQAADEMEKEAGKGKSGEQEAAVGGDAPTRILPIESRVRVGASGRRSAVVNSAAVGRGHPQAAKDGIEPALSRGAVYATLAISLGLGLAIFFALPVLVAAWLATFGVTPFWNNIVEGLIRLALFLAYLVAIGRTPAIQRVFQYHGAEHKTIAAFEAGAPLVPHAIRPYSKEHPRCGTGFVLTVVVISIIFFVLLGDLPLVWRLASRILLIPLVAAVSYELIRFASQHRTFPLFDWLIVRPSLALQSLTTREPTDEMIQVAVAAFQEVQRKEREEG